MLPPIPNRRLFLRVLACLALLPVIARSDEAPAPERDSLRLLTIGNSFADNALQSLPAIAKAGGKRLTVFRANLGGASLETHARHLRQAYAGDPAGHAYQNRPDPVRGGSRDFSLPEALELMKWDVVTIQQVSTQSYRPWNYEPHATALIEAIRKHAPTAEIVIHQTWAYRADHSLFRDGKLDRKAMHEGLRSSYRQLAKRHGLRLMPSGDAFDLANDSPGWSHPPGPGAGTLYARDGFHASAAGGYLAGAVWYLSLFNADAVPDGHKPSSLGAEQAAELRDFARRAVSAERARAR